jgi:exopolysaccharide biosynthesis protein
MLRHLQSGLQTAYRSARSLISTTKRAAALPVLMLLFCCGALFTNGSVQGEDGISHQNYVVRSEPWSIHVIRIDRKKQEYELTTTLGNGTRIGLGTLTEQLRRIPKQTGTPVAAINGDFYKTEGGAYSGDPRGLQIMRGELVSGPTERTCFWVDTDGNPRMGDVKPNFKVTWPSGEQTPFELNEDLNAQGTLYTSAAGRSTQTSGATEFVLEAVDPRKWLPLQIGEKYTARIREIRRGGNSRIDPGTVVLSIPRARPGSGAASVEAGDVVALSTESTPSLKGVKTAIGGGPALVHESKVQPARVSKSRERHPRSAIGWNQKEILFVEVDGRQRHSDGMTLPELAEFMLKLGCEEAMNLDGGASSEVWMNGKILNKPCHGQERNTGNALVLVEKKAEAQP